jgi:hypothetical protein
MFAYPGDRIGISGQQTITVRPTPTPVYSDQEKHAFWLAAITSKPPRVRFSSEIRESLTDKEESLNHVAFIMFSHENQSTDPIRKIQLRLATPLLQRRRSWGTPQPLHRQSSRTRCRALSGVDRRQRRQLRSTQRKDQLHPEVRRACSLKCSGLWGHRQPQKLIF